MEAEIYITESRSKQSIEDRAQIFLVTKTGQKHTISWGDNGGTMRANSGRGSNGATAFLTKFPVLGFSHGKLALGISASRLEKFSRDRPAFRTEFNHVSYIWEALQTAGLGYFYGRTPISRATELIKAVEKAEAKCDELKLRQQQIEMLMQRIVSNPKFSQTPAQIPDYKGWETLSNKKVTFGRRTEQIAALDILIKDLPLRKKNENKFVVLSRMQTEICSHLTTKGDSDRKEAVEELGARVTKVLDSLRRTPLDFDVFSPQEFDWAMTQLTSR